MKRMNKGKTGLGFLILAFVLCFGALSVQAREGRQLRKLSEQELDTIISKNDKTYSKKSEKQMRLNKTYKTKIEKIRSDPSYEVSRQTIERINEKMRTVNDAVTMLSNEKSQLERARSDAAGSDTAEKRKEAKIVLIQKQKKVNHLLSRINRDLEDVIRMLD